MYALEQLQQKSLKQLKEIGWQLNVLPASDRRCRQNWIDAIVGVNPPLLQLLEVSPVVSVQQVLEAIEPAAENSLGVDVDRAQQSIIETVENFPGVEPVTESNRNNFSAVDLVTEFNRNNFSGVEVDRVQKAIEVQAQEAIALAAENSPGVEVDCALESIENLSSLNPQLSQSAIALAAKNLPGSRSKASIAHQLLELFKSSAHIIEDSPGVKTEATVSESAIGLVAKNPILIGVTLSDRFCACYSPPQAQIIHFQSDADGQLSLLNFEIESVSEPPDPDDFESIEEFREASDRWHREHPEELAVSLDSFCEWAPCPDTWYESAEVVEVAPSVAIESSITCNFFIPTFDAWCDRFNRSDEPPDTGIYARLPKPKPPSFPLTAASQTYPKRIPKVFQTHPESIPKVSRTHTHCIAAGSSTQPARSPPGGDACLV
jgi:hypothetical protein